MKIRLIQQVLLKGQPRTFREMHKDIESDIRPSKGDMIYDTLWKDPCEYEVAEVSINYLEGVCYARLYAVELDSKNEDHVREYIELAKQHHGWQCNVL